MVSFFPFLKLNKELHVFNSSLSLFHILTPKTETHLYFILVLTLHISKIKILQIFNASIVFIPILSSKNAYLILSQMFYVNLPKLFCQFAMSTWL